MASRNYKPFVWTARYPRNNTPYEGLIAPQLQADIDNGADPWSPTDDRFSDDDLVEREASMGRSNFMLQFMLDTSLSDAEKFPLKMADLIVTSVNPTQAPDNIVWCSDPRNVLKDLPTAVYRETTSTHLCNNKASGQTIKKPSAQSTPPVEEPMKRQQPTYRKKMAYSFTRDACL